MLIFNLEWQQDLLEIVTKQNEKKGAWCSRRLKFWGQTIASFRFIFFSTSIILYCIVLEHSCSQERIISVMSNAFNTRGELQAYKTYLHINLIKSIILETSCYFNSIILLALRLRNVLSVIHLSAILRFE